MPAKKATKTKTATKRAKKVEKCKDPVCSHCDHLPLKSGELVAILLCLVFSLSAVLMTSLILVEEQQEKLDQYEQLMIRR